MLKRAEHPTVEQRVARGAPPGPSCHEARTANGSPLSARFSRSICSKSRPRPRVPELVPIRYGRMAVSPFAYYRGAALPMAADLSTAPHTGLSVQLCGDAHLSNFGGFASPERTMIFDVNDFDETASGPFEWDVKRLAASIEVAARGRNMDVPTRRAIVVDAVRSYQEGVRSFAGMPNLAVWYERLDLDAITRHGVASRPAVGQTDPEERGQSRVQGSDEGPGQAHHSLSAASPAFSPIHRSSCRRGSCSARSKVQTLEEMIRDTIRSYRRTLAGDRRRLLESYRYVDLARKVVGVGSVGTRAWVALFVGRDNDDTLILQVKEAEASVLERFLGKSPYANHGQRVVEGQRLMQAASDIFLGWQRVTAGVDGHPHDYYVRQLWDWKFSADVDAMPPSWPEHLRPGVRMDACSGSCQVRRLRGSWFVPWRW